MTKSDSKKTERKTTKTYSYVKKPVSKAKSYVSGSSNKDHYSKKKGLSYGKESKTPTNVERDPNPREVDPKKRKS